MKLCYRYSGFAKEYKVVNAFTSLHVKGLRKNAMIADFVEEHPWIESVKDVQSSLLTFLLIYLWVHEVVLERYYFIPYELEIMSSEVLVSLVSRKVRVFPPWSRNQYHSHLLPLNSQLVPQATISQARPLTFKKHHSLPLYPSTRAGTQNLGM